MKRIPKVTLTFAVLTALVLGCGNQAADITAQSQNEPEVVLEQTSSNTTPEEVQAAIQSEPTQDAVQESLIEPESEPEPIPEDCYATIVSFGDTLCHEPLFKAAYNAESGIYDFSYMFKYVNNYFEDATICIGNLESPMAGADRGYSGYPTFNTPEHLAIDLKELGVDVMTTANNHCLDKGFSGLSSTLDFLDDAGIAHTGTSRTAEEQGTVLFEDLNGIKTAFLSFTYGTNGIPLPEGKEFCVNLIDDEFILAQINQAKAEGSELIIVSMHWGIEYQLAENAEQDRLAELLVQNGVQVILGCHPHVLQPMKMLEVETDTGEVKKGLVIFSQGNFFSNQTKPYTQDTAIFNIEVKKDGKTNNVTVEKASYAPIYVNRKAAGSPDRYELLDLDEIIRSFEAGEGTWSQSMYNLAVAEKEKCESIIGPAIEN